MLTVPEALQSICQRLRPLPGEQAHLSAGLGRVLSEEIVASADSPPFDKALMDGYAVIAADTQGGNATLAVRESVTAGQVPTRPVGSGEATEIMTGAPMPDGADAVVPVEKTRRLPGTDEVRVEAAFAPGANLIAHGQSMRAGEAIFQPGHQLRPQDLALLAELGAARLLVRRRPQVAVLATGDELVPPDQTPGPGQIRNSNETLLASLAESLGCEAVPLGIARDEPAELRAKIEQGLSCDLLLLSGGVSAGVHDLVPGALCDCGVAEVFHKVNLKPGKPIWFGTRAETGRPDRLVFGLPGNPVSSLVCFELFVRTAIRGLAGEEVVEPQPVSATLDESIEVRGDRVVYYPCWIRIGEQGEPIAQPVPWAGSSDLRATSRANGMAVIEPGAVSTQGARVPAMVWSGNVVEVGRVK